MASMRATVINPPLEIRYFIECFNHQSLSGLKHLVGEKLLTEFHAELSRNGEHLLPEADQKIGELADRQALFD